MNKIGDYTGVLLSHVEALYRPGEREIAVSLATSLGCTITDTGFKGDGEETFLAVHPNPADADMQINAFYISPMRPEQQRVEARLLRLSVEDPDFGMQLESYRQAARSKPFGVPHFALRYGSGEAVEEVADRVRQAFGPAFASRVYVRVFRPQDPDGAGGTVVQGFVYQDIIVSGCFLYGQLIELQGQGAT